MSEILDKELSRLQLLGRPTLRRFWIANYALGINMSSTSIFRNEEALMIIINVYLMFAGVMTTYAQWTFVRIEYSKPSSDFKIYAESFCNVFEVAIFTSKMIYAIVMQNKSRKVVKTSKTYEILLECKIFELDIRNKPKLAREIYDILNKCRLDFQLQFNMFSVLVVTTAMTYMMIPISSLFYQRIIQRNPAATLEYPVVAVYPDWYGITYPFWYIINLATVQLSTFHCIALDGLFLVSCMHMLGMVRVLRVLINHVTDDEFVPPTLRVKYLSVCVQLYQKIYNFHKSIDGIFSLISLFQFCTGTVLICMPLYIAGFSFEQDYLLVFKMMVYLFVGISENAIYNLNAERSEKLLREWYNTNWYDECTQFKHIVKMMILRCGRFFKLQVGGFAELSAATFQLMLNRGVSAYLIINKFF